ncbi:DNA-directed RNA polymerase subunit alpha [Candidatus Gracilibacteria bacterium GN02-873]|jgi:DNA-directed RNA polymerase, alpha subunit|nr:DNA-directed RNA polymerase subunit alpha [Candidatus Gracilibacteria bacterium GN02-873]
MHTIHTVIGVPKISQEVLSENEATFTIDPLPNGYGVTLGNSLRRVMLSSIPGTRVTGVKIAGVSHEYATLPGVHDSVLDILLNLKGLVVEKPDSGVEWITLSKKEPGIVTAGDITEAGGIKILNPDMYITSLDAGFSLDIQIRVEKNVGYASIEHLKNIEEDPNLLVVDANFSPVLNVKYTVENARYGEITNLDALHITIKTNGVMSPADVVKFSGKMLESYFALFNEEALQVGGEFIANIREVIEREKQEVKADLEKETYTPIEIMGLSPRTLNALVNGDILSIEQLAKCTEAKLSSIKGFGRKAMTEVREALAARGLKLLGDD